MISEIQHENLVKLYGCCVEGNHRILVYNYLENKSLDMTLLGDSLSFLLSKWPFLWFCNVISNRMKVFQLGDTLGVGYSLTGVLGPIFVLGLLKVLPFFMKKYGRTLFIEISKQATFYSTKIYHPRSLILDLRDLCQLT